ncbi:MAG TPA: protease HtpX [Gammaproteobacteria bacterium]|jgi:heat shock protein HtpX|nr:protease HtpX [Gammaproteobacteria bacterium]
MKRVALFLATNIAVLAVIYVVLNVLGIDRVMAQSGSALNLGALLAFSAVVGFSGALVSLAMSKWIAKMSTGARVIDTPRNATETWLLSTVYRQADAANIRRPEVAIYDSPDVNAFATGPTRNNALVAVSTGLLQRLGQREIEAVLGHEVTHVANGDMVTLTLIQGVVNTFVVFLSRIVGFVVDRVLLRNERGAGAGFFLASLVAQILLGILASMIVMWFSRQREFRADAGGARLAGRDSMIAALRGLQRVHEQGPLPEALQAFGIAGGRASGLRRLFMSHPPLEERIAALERNR